MCILLARFANPGWGHPERELVHCIGPVCLLKVGVIQRVDLYTVLARFAYPRWGLYGEWTCELYWPGLPTHGVGHPESGLVHRIGQGVGSSESGLGHGLGQVYQMKVRSSGEWTYAPY